MGELQRVAPGLVSLPSDNGGTRSMGDRAGVTPTSTEVPTGSTPPSRRHPGPQASPPDCRALWELPQFSYALQTTLRHRFSLQTMNRVRVVWSNFPGAPGYSNFYVGSTITDHTPIRTFFSTMATYLPGGLTITVPTSGDVISEATGAITGAYSATVTGGPMVTPSNAGAYAGMAGGQIQWQTSLLVAGRRPLGKTFLVPGYSNMFDTNGSLATAFITACQTAGATLISALSGELKVWTRPRPSLAGAAATITSCRVPDLAIALRSRRI